MNQLSDKLVKWLRNRIIPAGSWSQFLSSVFLVRKPFFYIILCGHSCLFCFHIALYYNSTSQLSQWILQPSLPSLSNIKPSYHGEAFFSLTRMNLTSCIFIAILSMVDLMFYSKSLIVLLTCDHDQSIVFHV